MSENHQGTDAKRPQRASTPYFADPKLTVSPVQYSHMAIMGCHSLQVQWRGGRAGVNKLSNGQTRGMGASPMRQLFPRLERRLVNTHVLKVRKKC
jgi:hypothetical protein